MTVQPARPPDSVIRRVTAARSALGLAGKENLGAGAPSSAVTAAPMELWTEHNGVLVVQDG